MFILTPPILASFGCPFTSLPIDFVARHASKFLSFSRSTSYSSRRQANCFIGDVFAIASFKSQTNPLVSIQ